MVLGFFLSATVVNMSSEDVVNAPAFPLPVTLLRAIYDGTIGQSPAWDTPELRDWYLDTNYAVPVPPETLEKLNVAFGLAMEGRWSNSFIGPGFFRTAARVDADQSVMEAVLHRLQCTCGNFSPSAWWEYDRRISSVHHILAEKPWSPGDYMPTARYLVLWAFVEALHASIRYGRCRHFDLCHAFNHLAKFSRLTFWPPAMQCYASLGSTLQAAKDVQSVVSKVRLPRLLVGAHSSDDLRPLLSTSGGRFLLRLAVVFMRHRLSLKTVSAILHLMPMGQWLHEEPRLQDVWLEVSSRVPRRGWSRQKPKSASLPAACFDANFIWYRLLRHYIAVDRAILRHYFRCTKGSLGRLNHDVISDIEHFIYGRHSWPRWFLRDFYRTS